MAGEEASFFALTDGTAIPPFSSAQDHKRGVVTAMWGRTPAAWAPIPRTGADARICRGGCLREIIEPTVRTMRRGPAIPYSGVLYCQG